ncbi:MAG: hypothetical protein HC912_10735 [Saprospiraceae bacterium]|nr:hypothetical protein [Saprospiraceae bacterium]
MYVLRLRFYEAIFNPSWNNPLSIIVWTLFAGIAVVVVAKLMGADLALFGRKKALHHSPDAVRNSNDQLPNGQSLEALIQKAIQQKAYSEALRWQYLALIEQLIKQGWLRKELQHTNSEYLIQLRKHPNYEQIRACTLLFEYGYYGGFHLQSSHWEQAQALFASIKT